MHWLRLRVSGRRTFSSDSQLSVSWSTCGGPEGAKRRCHGEDKAILKGRDRNKSMTVDVVKGRDFKKEDVGVMGQGELLCVKGTKTSDSQVWQEGKSLGKRKGKRTGGCCHGDITVDNGYF